MTYFEDIRIQVVGAQHDLAEGVRASESITKTSVEATMATLAMTRHLRSVLAILHDSYKKAGTSMEGSAATEAEHYRKGVTALGEVSVGSGNPRLEQAYATGSRALGGMNGEDGMEPGLQAAITAYTEAGTAMQLTVENALNTILQMTDSVQAVSDAQEGVIGCALAAVSFAEQYLDEV